MVDYFTEVEAVRNFTALDKWGEQLLREAQCCEKLTLKYGIGVPAGVRRITQRTADRARTRFTSR